MSNDERSSDLPETISLCDQSDGETYALLIGVDWYNCFDLNTEDCANDVDLFKQCLHTKVGIKSFTELTSRSINFQFIPFHHIIDYQLDSLFQEATNKDKLIIMFSGHGFEVDGDTYLAPADLIAYEENGEQRHKTETAISLKDLVDRLDKSPAKFKWLIVNACRERVAGSIDSSSSGLRNGNLFALERTVILQSCQSGEKSWICESDVPSGTPRQDRQATYSIFISTLVDALSGAADFDKDDVITMKDVINYVINQTHEELRRRNKEQTPVCTSGIDNLETIIVCNWTEGMTADQLQKGKELISDAERWRDLARKSSDKRASILAFKEAREIVEEALKLIPESGYYRNHFNAWSELLEAINSEIYWKNQALQNTQTPTWKDEEKPELRDKQDTQKDMPRVEDVGQKEPLTERGVSQYDRSALFSKEQKTPPSDERNIARINDSETGEKNRENQNNPGSTDPFDDGFTNNK